MINNSEVCTKDLDKLENIDVINDLGENANDSLEQKSAKALHQYKIISRYVLLVLGIAISLLFGCRFLHLINNNEKIIDIYLQSRDWHILVIYGISMAFTASMIITPFIYLLSYLKNLSK